MRKSKTIKIDSDEYTVKELRVKDVIELFDQMGDKETEIRGRRSEVGGRRSGAGEKDGLDDLMGMAENFMPKFTDVTIDRLKEMAPSEIRELYEVFREVNADFFVLGRALGLEKMGAALKSAIVKDFSALLAGSLSRGMENVSSIMAGRSS